MRGYGVAGGVLLGKQFSGFASGSDSCYNSVLQIDTVLTTHFEDSEQRS
jgi:hypothetical protein